MDLKLLYARHLKKFLKLRTAIKIVCDASGGAAGVILKKISDPNLEVVLANARTRGNFPAHGPGPTPRDLWSLAREVLARGADLGAVLDADGDRIRFIDNRGKFVHPDEAAFAISENFRPPYAVSVNVGWLMTRHKRTARSSVGHLFLKNLMRKRKLEFGAEHSGHYYFKFQFGNNFAYYDSGIRALLEMCNFTSGLKKKGQSLFEFLADLPPCARLEETNFKVKDMPEILKKVEKKYRKTAHAVSKLDGLKMEFEDFWFLLRRSNTEPLLRLNMEAQSAKVLHTEFLKVKKLILTNT